MQEAADGAVMDLVSTALGWTALASTMWPFCIDPPVTVAAETPPDPTVAPPRPCVGREWAHGITPSVKSPDFDVAGMPVSLSLQAKCEELKAEISGKTDIPFVSTFAQATLNAKGVTVFAGIKAGSGFETAPLNVSAKEGFFWKIDTQGNCYDYGVRIDPFSVSAESTPYGLKVWENKPMEFSFVGISDYMPLIGSK